MTMYDNIKITTSDPFFNDVKREHFINRFGLFVKDEKKGTYHNKGYDTLKQNKGLFIILEPKTEHRKGKLSICFSMHKFYNAMTGNTANNYTGFSFRQANVAYGMIVALLGIDIGGAVVKKYEIGINITTPDNPDIYMQELSHVLIGSRELRIIEDVHQKEYKQFSTNKNRDKRVVYIFYNKTFEARSKLKQTHEREAIPENILRMEKDTVRPVERILFRQLFEPGFQQLARQEFINRFERDLYFKSFPVKTKEFTTRQLDVIKITDKIGTESAKVYYARMRKDGALTKRQIEKVRKIIRDIEAGDIHPEYDISKRAKEFKLLIINALCAI